VFECDVCGHRFTRKDSFLTQHLIHHFNPEAFQCDICLKKFTNNQQIKKHKTAVHQIVRESKFFECQVCHIRCKSRISLNGHKMVHQPKKTCEICQKSYSAGSYPYHIKTHEMKKQEKKFECQVCQKKFFTKQLLNYHKKTHEKPFECDLCRHQIARKDIMKYHLNKHLEKNVLKMNELYKCI
jgi:hypothetical protein